MTLDYKGSKIFYTDEGKGKAIILLHGFLENSSMWQEITTVLALKNRVICIDLLGHGQTECVGYIHTMETMADAVKAVTKQLKLRKIDFIGHSMGGYVALAFAKKHPENIRSLCLLNSTAQADSEERKQIRLRAIEMAKTNYTALVKMGVSNLFAPTSNSLFKEAINTIKKEALQTPLQGYLAATEGMRLRENTESVLQSIPKRLIITGEHDPILPLEIIEAEAKRTQTPLTIVPNGHMSYIEAKEEVIQALQDFL